MNTLTEIIANAMDLSGATNPAVNLPVNVAALHAMNTLADMQLELAHSTCGRSSVKLSQTLALSESGTLDSLPNYIRFRGGFGNCWTVIDIVSDIEDLNRARNEGRFAILIYGANAPYSYELSFSPAISISAELWGSNQNTTEPNTLGAIVIPAQFSQIAAARTALVLLDDLLLAPNAAQMMAFIQSRKPMLTMRLRNLEHWWTVYRSNADNNQNNRNVTDYDPFDDNRDISVFENQADGITQPDTPGGTIFDDDYDFDLADFYENA